MDAPSGSDRRLNATAASLLGFLEEGPMSGWDLVVTAQRRIGDFWSLTASQVYRELAGLAEAGLVERGERGPRARLPYQLTTAGHAAFSAWVNTPPGEETIRFPLLLKIMFGRHVERERLAEYVRAHRELHAARLEAYEGQRLAPRDGVPVDPFAAAALDFGIRYERAVIDWFDELPATVAGQPS